MDKLGWVLMWGAGWYGMSHSGKTPLNKNSIFPNG
jgi:hypothetical protein